MEKRMILALVLSFLVLIVWSAVFGPSRTPDTEEKRTHTKAAPETAPTPPPSKPVTPSPSVGSEPPAGPEPVPTVEERQIEVETPLYKAVFSNVGPGIKSFKLKKYRRSTDPDSPLVELVKLEETRGEFLEFAFNGLPAEGGSSPVYEVERQRINMTAGSNPETLDFQKVYPSGVTVRKTYRFHPDSYRIDLDMVVGNHTENPLEGSISAHIKAKPEQGKRSFYSYVGLVLLHNEELEEVEIEEPSETKVINGTINWMGYEDDYFLTAVVPEKSPNATFKAGMKPTGVLHGSYLSPSASVRPGETYTSHYSLYFGPRDLEVLKDFGSQLDRVVDFGWTNVIAKPLLYALRFFNQYIGNYGVSIILLTVLIKILFWPLTHKSFKSMKELQKLQPRMAKIREKYKNNKEQMNKEMMALYKTYKVNPMGGCLPMIIQIPVFFALYRILGNAIELRHAPFALWIDDLSAPDRLFNFGFDIPLMAPPSGIPVLTLLMGASMFVQQKLTPSAGDPTQAKIMMFLPIIFTFVFINFPSGLVLYWLVNNLLSIGQQYRIHRST